MWAWFTSIFAVAVLVFLGWASDSITLQGERTIYTVSCDGGTWRGAYCNGRLVAAERFRFRALRTPQEVVFWTVGASAPSGKFTDCIINDGRNWSCKPSADSARTITLQMVHGAPTVDHSGSTRGFHSVAKWKWLLLKWGLPAGSEADV